MLSRCFRAADGLEDYYGGDVGCGPSRVSGRLFRRRMPTPTAVGAARPVCRRWLPARRLRCYWRAQW